MFTTSGMRESHQSDIELKGVSASGLKKCIDIIYTSRVRFDSHADMFDTLAAATHLQCLLVVDLCEKIFLQKLTCQNFNYFTHMAKLYGMSNALRQIDLFIVNNLREIICHQEFYLKQKNQRQNLNSEEDEEETKFLTNQIDFIDEDKLSKFLTYEQLNKCLQSNTLCLKEIDLFLLTWKWIYQNIFRKKGRNIKASKSLKMIRCLMKHIRFVLISPKDLVETAQNVNELMTSDKYLRQMILNALSYHLLPISKINLFENISLRAPFKTIVTIGGK